MIGYNVTPTSGESTPVSNGAIKRQDAGARSLDPDDASSHSARTSSSSRSSEDHTDDDTRRYCRDNKGCLSCLNSIVIRGLEKFFYEWGYYMGAKPWFVLLCCLVFTASMIPGLIFFWEEEYAPDKLWVPDDSQALLDKQFVDEHFPLRQRFEFMIPESSNVLTPNGLQAMLDLDIRVKNILTEPRGLTWKQVCARFGTTCGSRSILELWSFNETVIRSLSRQEIVDAINGITISPVFGTEYDASRVLGDVVIDPATGNITAAKATFMQWFLKSNFTESQGEDADILNWEEQFLAIGSEGVHDMDNLYYFAGKSFMDEAVSAIIDDVALFAMGYILVIIFVALVLGRFSRIRHRIYIALAGVVCVGLAIIVSYGLCSYAGLFYGPLHSVLPFLLLGIGIDDTFVICQNLDQLPHHMDELSSRERIGYALKHAGVSITVTSLTDIVAFAVGAVTVIPALWSFCGYAAVGILATYIFQTTFFVACLVYDDVRVKQNRNACCCCIVHKDSVPPECSNKLLVQSVFEKIYAPYITKLPVKICVVISAAVLLGVSIWGVINLEQEFDVTWFLPGDSYSRHFTEAFDHYFPLTGTPASVYYGDINYYTDYDKLEDMYFDLRSNKFVAPSSVDCWYFSFRVWMNETTDPSALPLLGPDRYPISEDAFYTLLWKFVFIPSNDTQPKGIRFIADFDFNETNKRIDASRMRFQYINLQGAAMEIEAMDDVRDLISSYGYPISDNFVYSLSFLMFEGNKAIKKELFRNLGLALICIFLMTLFLLSDLISCLLVCLCVVMSLVDVGGCMQFWGLTIDEVTAINLILAIGLTVDYSAHVAHSFLSSHGNKKERVIKTLNHIGPPVFYGGFTTFLAFVLLASSDSYVFLTFFKIFLLVVLFGLFHGLALMPVLLSWIGPGAYQATPQHQPSPEQQTRDNHPDTDKSHLPSDFQESSVPELTNRKDESRDPIEKIAIIQVEIYKGDDVNEPPSTTVVKDMPDHSPTYYNIGFQDDGGYEIISEIASTTYM